MASYTYIVQHTLNFGTKTGTQTSWELDILRGYEGSTPPAWASNPPQDLIGGAEPIEIEWLRDYDVYKPIQGSQAKLNLLVTPSVTYPDFSDGSQFEYQLRLRRRVGSLLQDYWCGFIQAIDGQEAVLSAPFPITFTATDGLGRLEDSTVEFDMDSITPINLFEQVLASLFQTGLNLPVYVESGIRNANGDALFDVTAHPYSLLTSTNENIALSSRMTRKELIEGLLSAFNCTIRQSEGKWYIFNASTHGGTGATEEITWKTFIVSGTDTEYTASSDVTEDLRFNINSGTNSDLVPINEDMVLNTRRPYGSVECRPQNIREKNYITDPCFEEGHEGIEVNTASLDQTITRSQLGSSTGSPESRLINNTLSARFSSTDTSLTFEDVIVTPVMGSQGYSSGTTFTITGGTATNYIYSGTGFVGSAGDVQFDLSVALPTFSSSNPIGDVTIDVSIDGVTPNLTPATTATIVSSGAIPGDGGASNLTVTANGAWRVAFGDPPTDLNLDGNFKVSETAGVGGAVFIVEADALPPGVGARGIPITIVPSDSLTVLASVTQNQLGRGNDNPSNRISNTAPAVDNTTIITFVIPS